MRPFSLLIKPSGPDCNLDCKYCFYSHKSSLFGKDVHRMSDDVLDRLIKNHLALNLPESSFAWQGGEPTLMGLDFYKKAVELQKKYGEDGQTVSNAFQTNGILLDENWCRFLCEYRFLVGISLDGPKQYHDYYRLNKAGNGTFSRVMAAVENCRRHNVEFNILVLLNDKNVKGPDELFDFFTDQKIKYLQFVPCVEKEPSTGKVADFSITAKQYGDFLCRIFDRWYEYGPDKLSIRIFDSVLNYIVHSRHTNCTFGRRCNDYVVIEHSGDVFCCDFFVEDQFRLGNILESSIEELFQSKIKKQFSDQKNNIHNKCLICRHNAICRGGCLKDRIVANGSFTDPSYFCQAYKEFFDYSLPKLSQLAAEIMTKNAKDC
jgi:uncharacterized protein